MGHQNEEVLRDLYAVFAKGDIEGFLAGCTDDVTFDVPGNAAVSGSFVKSTFMDLLAPVMQLSNGTFQEEVVDVFANDDHGVLLLRHTFDRAGVSRQYLTSHIVTMRDGQISSWREYPGSDREFTEAWGTKA